MPKWRSSAGTLPSDEAPACPAPRLAADALRPPARPARSFPARHRDRGHRPWPRARRALEWPDERGSSLLGRAAFPAGRGDRAPARSRPRSARRALRAAARCRRICDRRHHLAVQGRARRQLSRSGAAHPRCGDAALRPRRRRPHARQDPAKRADTIAAYHEATQLAGFTAEEAALYFGKPERLPQAILALLDPWTTQEAESAYLQRFAALSDALQQQSPRVKG